MGSIMSAIADDIREEERQRYHDLCVNTGEESRKSIDALSDYGLGMIMRSANDQIHEIKNKIDDIPLTAAQRRSLDEKINNLLNFLEELL